MQTFNHAEQFSPSVLALAVGLFVFSGHTLAQVDIGASFDCLRGICDANTSDEDGDHHGVTLEDHLAEARASGNAATQQSAFAEVGLRFQPCFSGEVSLGMHDIDIDGRLRGFGGGPVIRGEVDVRTILRDISDDVELVNEVIFEEEERGQIGVTVNRDFSENAENVISTTLTANHTYDFVLRVNARKFGLNGMSDFQQGGRGVSFDRISILPLLDDTDGDGLSDQWEISGVDQDCDGTVEIDLPAMGADPTIKDVFVELDWMTGQEPTQAAVSAVVDAFALAPPGAGGVSTPGEGINLLFDTGDLTDPVASEDGAGAGSCSDGVDNGGGDGADRFDNDCLVGAQVFASLSLGGAGLGGGNEFPVSGIPDLGNDADADGESDFQEAKLDPARGNFDPVRAQVFRYGINAVAGGPPPNMGGQASGNDFVLFNRNAGLLMHELGHTLGLGHGGPFRDEPTTNDVNCKPNYVSVMNYRFQGGIQVAGGVGNGQDIDGNGIGDGMILDFSPPRFLNGRGFAPLADIDETAWSEVLIQDGSDPANISAWTTGNQGLVSGQLSAAPNWNGDNDNNDQAPPAIDFNTSIWNQAATEGSGPANSCSDGIDNDGNGQIDAADQSCIANPRCGLAANASVQQYSGADDWSNLALDPNRFAQVDDGAVPGWFDEPSEEEIEAVQAAMQTTDLVLASKSSAPDPVVAGQPLDFTVTIENRGPNQAGEVRVIDILSPELHFIGGEPGCELVGENTVECAIGGLAAGETRDAIINTRVSVDVACAPGEQFATLINSARVENVGGFDTEPDNDLGRVEAQVLCARYEYSAKFVCGEQRSFDDPRLATGRYRTTVNIHNPNDESVTFFKKLALSFPPERQRPGKVVPIAIDELGYDEALKADCSEASKLIGEAGYIEGYLVVQSPFSLDVDAIYTAETPVGHGGRLSTSIDVEAIDERERKPSPRPDVVVLPLHPEPPFDERFGVQLPEGIPESLFCGDNGPSGGAARTVDAIVRNIGLGDAGPSTLRIKFAGAGTDDVVVGALTPGASAEVSIAIPRACYQIGACSFELAADAPDTLAESDESNNGASSSCLSPAG